MNWMLVLLIMSFSNGWVSGETYSEGFEFIEAYHEGNTDLSADAEPSMYDIRYTDHEVSNRFEGYEYLTLQPKLTKPYLPESINREQPYLENNIESKVENKDQVSETRSKNKSAYIIQAYITGGFCCFGLAGNILALVILHSDKDKLPLVYFLIVLSVCDWLVSLTMLNSTVVPTFCEYNGYIKCMRRYTAEVRFSLWVFGSVLQTISVWIIACVSLDRFIAICFPYKSIKICTKKNTMRATVIICMFSLILNTPLAFYNFKLDNTKVLESELHGNMSELLLTSSGDFQPEPEPILENNHKKLPEDNKPSDMTYEKNEKGSGLTLGSDDDDWEHESERPGDIVLSGVSNNNDDYDMGPAGAAAEGGWFIHDGRRNLGQNTLYRYIYLVGCNWTFCFILPSLILLYVNPRLMYEIEKSRRTPHGVKTKRDRHSLSVTVNIVAVVTIFLLCQTPTFVSAVVMKGDITDDREAIEYLVAVANLGQAVNSSVNIVLYVMFYKKFRKIAMEVLCAGQMQTFI